MYLFDTHVHTSQVSHCGKLPAEDMVELYKKAGYSGFCMTDHINPYTFQDLDLPTWADKTEFFLSGYRAAKKAAGDNLTILLGAEFCFYENHNDYLVYGLTEEILASLGDDILDWGIERFSAYCREKGLLLIQAHPFRNHMTVTKPELVDGIEVMNGHPGHDSRNFLARAWADHYGLLRTSGSDAHRDFHAARGGFKTEEPIESLSQLIDVIKNGPELIIPEDQMVFFK